MKNLIIIIALTVTFLSCDNNPMVSPPCNTSFTRFMPLDNSVDSTSSRNVDFSGVASCHQNSFTILVSYDDSFSNIAWSEVYTGHTYFYFSHEFGINKDTLYWKIKANYLNDTVTSFSSKLIFKNP